MLDFQTSVQLVKNLPAMQETPVQFRVRKICWRKNRLPTPLFLGFSCGSAGKESACNAEDLGLIPGLRWSSGDGKGYPLKYSGLENSMDCIVHGVAKLDTTEWLSLSLSKHCNKWEKPHFPVKIFKSKVFSTDEYLLWDSGNSFLQGRCFFFFLS